MSDRSKIQWTDATWNPVRGCSKVSAGCAHCYAERQLARFSGPGGYAHGFVAGGRWTGRVQLVPDRLYQPTRWRRPRRVFVNSTSDLFHEDLHDQAIDSVFAVMAACPQHVFQVLTKRPERMLTWFEGRALLEPFDDPDHFPPLGALDRVWSRMGIDEYSPSKPDWPLPNVWLGVSVEDQASADERIPLLLETPAAVRFVSAEPLLERVDLSVALGGPEDVGGGEFRSRRPVDWVIVGGESGPSARPCDLDWIRAIVADCRVAAVPVFVKQLGARPRVVAGEEDVHFAARSIYVERTIHLGNPATLALRDRKGGDPAEWPEDLRVREFPRA